MYLTSVSNLKLSKTQFEIIDTMSFTAKSLYNAALYQVNKYFKETGEYLDFGKLDLLMKNLVDDAGKIVYRNLPAQVSQQTLKKLDKNYNSFFKLLKKKQTNDYDRSINSPKYLPKDGRKELIFQKQSFRVTDSAIELSISKELKDKFNLKFLSVPLPQYLKGKMIKYIEIIPGMNSQYSLHIVYEIQEEVYSNNDVKNWCSIDLGLNNLATVTSNVHKPYLINGRPIKSINQKFNKKIAKLKSKIKKGTSKQIQQLYTKRGNKLNNEIHKITDFIIKAVKESDIDTVVIGYNKGWKQGINIGKRNNQNFTQIPFHKVVQQLQYKLQLLGIELILQEESYTSKTSFFDKEPVHKHQTYQGRRVKRGLFRTNKGILVNADVNGSLNIFRKAIKNLQKEVHDTLLEPVDIGFVMNPARIELKTSLSSTHVFLQIESIKIS